MEGLLIVLMSFLGLSALYIAIIIYNSSDSKFTKSNIKLTNTRWFVRGKNRLKTFSRIRLRKNKLFQ
jgi:hypothetical protein